MNILAVIFILLLGLLFFKVRLSTTDSTKSKKPKKGRDRSPQGSISAKSPFGAVSVEFPEDACTAVRKLEGQKFLRSEAPITPLRDCSGRHCQCRYVHYNDRRSQEDQRDPLASTNPLQPSERRSKRERRRVDASVTLQPDSYRKLLDDVVEAEHSN